MRRTVLLALLLVGCGAGRHEVRAATLRATADLSCPQRDLTSVWVGGGGVNVSGCGMRLSYTCLHDTCAPDGRPTGVHRDPTPALDAVGSSGPDRDVALAAVAECCLAADTRLDFVVGVNGDVLRIDTGAQDACVADHLRRAQFATRRDAESVSVTTPGAVRAPTRITVTAASTAPSQAHAVIEGLRESILLCNGGTPTAVVGDWSADGALTVHLPDARAGSPEDGCVRQAAEGAHLDPTPGSAGSVLHAVH